MQPQLPQFPGSNLLAVLIVDLIKNSLCLILSSEPQRDLHLGSSWPLWSLLFSSGLL